jgi:hypothetical protein
MPRRAVQQMHVCLPQRAVHLYRRVPTLCNCCCPCCHQGFLEAEGTKNADGTRDDPPLAKFEEQIQKYK